MQTFLPAPLLSSWNWPEDKSRDRDETTVMWRHDTTIYDIQIIQHDITWTVHGLYMDLAWQWVPLSVDNLLTLPLSSAHRPHLDIFEETLHQLQTLFRHHRFCCFHRRTSDVQLCRCSAMRSFVTRCYKMLHCMLHCMLHVVSRSIRYVSDMYQIYQRQHSAGQH